MWFPSLFLTSPTKKTTGKKTRIEEKAIPISVGKYISDQAGWFGYWFLQPYQSDVQLIINHYLPLYTCLRFLLLAVTQQVLISFRWSLHLNSNFILGEVIMWKRKSCFGSGAPCPLLWESFSPLFKACNWETWLKRDVFMCANPWMDIKFKVKPR